MEPFWDLLLQLMKHGTDTSHVAFIFVLVAKHTEMFSLDLTFPTEYTDYTVIA